MQQLAQRFATGAVATEARPARGDAAPAASAPSAAGLHQETTMPKGVRAELGRRQVEAEQRAQKLKAALEQLEAKERAA